jgi:hypothetical protein
MTERVKLFRNLGRKADAAGPAPPRGYVSWTLQYVDGPKRDKLYRNADGAVLKDVVFQVSEVQRQRIVRMLKETGLRKKKPHAFAVGVPVKVWAEMSLARTLGPADMLKGGGSGMVRVGYDPFTTPTFIREDCGTPVFESPLVIATPTGVYAKLPPCSKRSLRGLEDFEFSQDPFAWEW